MKTYNERTVASKGIGTPDYFTAYTGDGVYLDSVNGVAGTAYPIGTPAQPVSNLTDALTILAARKLRKIYVIDSATHTVPSDIDLIISFVGLGEDIAFINGNSKDINLSSFRDITFNGISAGMVFAYNCVIAGTHYGAFYNCAIGSLTLDGTGVNLVSYDAVTLSNCIFLPNSVFTPGAYDAHIDGAKGDLNISGMTGGTVNITSSGLKLTLNASCTGGTINIYGDAKIIDNSAGTTVNDYTNRPIKDVAVSVNAIVASESNFLSLQTSNFQYAVDDLTLKCVDPGANTVNVRLYQYVNAVSTNIRTFAITTANFATYFNLVDMFGKSHLNGSVILITVQATAGGPYAVTGSYAYRSA